MFYRLAAGAVKGGESLLALILEYLQRQNIHCMIVEGDNPDSTWSNELTVAAAVAKKVADKEADGGIVIDGFGIGASITANKFKGVRASRCTSETTARYTRCHNDSNIMCLGYKSMGAERCLDLVKVWINSEFEGGRHAISVNLIRRGEERQFWEEGFPASAEEKGKPWEIRGAIKRVYVANDHAGFEAKGLVMGLLRERKIEVVDMGTESTEIVRYPYYAARVAHKVLESSCNGGVLLCGTGIGMSIAANKFRGIRAALCTCESDARYAREYLDSNVLCVGGKIIGQFELEDGLNAWLDTEFRKDLQTDLAELQKVEDRNLRDTDWKPADNT